MKTIVAGGRYFSAEDKHMDWLLKKFEELKVSELVCGMATGADNFGYATAELLDIPIKQFPANWNKYGKAAGPIRNRQMAEYADICILFPGGNGTKNMKEEAIKRGLRVVEWEDD